MPRDDLSIDFVKRMPQAEPLDPGLILDDWINRVQNLPEEIRFIQEEISEKDRQYNECIRIIDDRDLKIQKWIKTNGSLEPNPKEDLLRAQIREGFDRAGQISDEKVALMSKLQIVMDKHLRSLDVQIKLLYDRAEPGFTDPDEVPSLLRPSAANHSAPSLRSLNLTNNVVTNGPAAAASPRNAAAGAATPATAGRPPNHPQARNAPAQAAHLHLGSQFQQHAASAPATPAASIILNRQRESSAGPATKRGPRSNLGSLNAPATSSGLARHSSLGPGPPKSGLAATIGAGGAVRAGSAGPRAGSVKAAAAAGSRKGTPTAAARKKPPNKSSLSRVKKASNRNSPASTVESDLSDADSASGEDDEVVVEARFRATRGAPGAGAGAGTGTGAGTGKGAGAGVKDADGDEVLGDADEDDENGDDKKYCLCHNVSYGDMVACDNEDCPYEWFHWSCVGLKSEPNGTWYCPVCCEKYQSRKGK